MESGEGAADLIPPVQRRAAGACVVDRSAVERRPSVLLFCAFNAATARSKRRLLLQETTKKAGLIRLMFTFSGEFV